MYRSYKLSPTLQYLRQGCSQDGCGETILIKYSVRYCLNLFVRGWDGGIKNASAAVSAAAYSGGPPLACAKIRSTTLIFLLHKTKQSAIKIVLGTTGDTEFSVGITRGHFPFSSSLLCQSRTFPCPKHTRRRNSTPNRLSITCNMVERQNHNVLSPNYVTTETTTLVLVCLDNWGLQPSTRDTPWEATPATSF